MLLLSLGSLGTFKMPMGTDLSTKITVPQLQDAIEAAWDAGINSHGRIQTGGIKCMRKHIGTSEVSAVSSHVQGEPNAYVG